MKEISSVAEREAVLEKLYVEHTRKDQNYTLDAVERLIGSVEEGELIEGDASLIILHSRALYRTGKYALAYQLISEALKKDMGNPDLHAERESLLEGLQKTLIYFIEADVLDPNVESLYLILKQEGYLSKIHHLGYIRYLNAHHREIEAAKIAIPVVKLYPGALGLRPEVEKIAAKVPHVVFEEYLRSFRPEEGRLVPHEKLSPAMAHSLSKKISRVFDMLNEEKLPVHLVEKEVAEVIGRNPDLEKMNPAHSKFYYLQGILEERKENYMGALMIFKRLVELFPFELNFRRSLEIESNRVIDETMALLLNGKFKGDLLSLYSVLREFEVLPAAFIAEVCLEEVRRGEGDKARQKMDMLLLLYPRDAEVLAQAFRVAEALGDSEWQLKLDNALQEILLERPWEAPAASRDD